MKINPKALWYVDPGISAPTYADTWHRYCSKCNIVWLVEGALCCADCGGTIPLVRLGSYVLDPKKTLVTRFYVTKHNDPSCPLAGPLSAQQLTFIGHDLLPGGLRTAHMALCTTCRQLALRVSASLEEAIRCGHFK